MENQIIILPNGDAIHASDIDHVYLHRGRLGLGHCAPAGVEVNERFYPLPSTSYAEHERDRLVREWRVAFASRKVIE